MGGDLLAAAEDGGIAVDGQVEAEVHGVAVASVVFLEVVDHLEAEELQEAGKLKIL